METIKNLTQLQLIKRVILVGLGVVTVSWLISAAFTSTMSSNKAAVKERNRIEMELKVEKQEVDKLEKNLNIKRANVETLRAQRQAATDQINNWINEGLAKSQ